LTNCPGTARTGNLRHDQVYLFGRSIEHILPTTLAVHKNLVMTTSFTYSKLKDQPARSKAARHLCLSFPGQIL
jgi:hypothetical protein